MKLYGGAAPFLESTVFIVNMVIRSANPVPNSPRDKSPSNTETTRIAPGTGMGAELGGVVSEDPLSAASMSAVLQPLAPSADRIEWSGICSARWDAI